MYTSAAGLKTGGYGDAVMTCDGARECECEVATHPLKLFDLARKQGRPLYTSAPMVRYSKLAFRQTVHEYGVDLCWTPMILAKEFNRSALARDSDFTLPSPSSRIIPTIVQFGASSPTEFARATSLVAPYAQGVDLNCGCPQSWACAESLGAALMEKRELVAETVKEARAALQRDGWESKKTVSVKIRIHKDLRRTIDFIHTVQAAGVDFLTIHGRTRSTRSTIPVNADAVALLRSHIPTLPVLFNGDVTSLLTAQHLADTSGCDGVMAARALIRNPALFAGHTACPWSAVEIFLNRVVGAPIPFALVLHHVAEMCGDGGHGEAGALGRSGALLDKAQRRKLSACVNMLELVDYLDEVRES